jgi:hypothetical protein
VPYLQKCIFQNKQKRPADLSCETEEEEEEENNIQKFCAINV